MKKRDHHSHNANHHKPSSKKEKNNYKFMFHVLLIVIISAVAIYLISLYGDSSYTEGAVFGQQNVMAILINEVETKGSVTITLDNNDSLVLVPVETVQYGQERLVQEIVDVVGDQGFINLETGDGVITLLAIQGNASLPTN